MRSFFQKHSRKIVGSLLVLLILTAAYFWGDGSFRDRSPADEEKVTAFSVPSKESVPSPDPAVSRRQEKASHEGSMLLSSSVPESSLRSGTSFVPVTSSETSSPEEEVPQSETEEQPMESSLPDVEPSNGAIVPKADESSGNPAENVSGSPEKTDDTPEKQPSDSSEVSAVSSREESPAPPEEHRCTFAISCRVLLDHRDQLSKNKRSLVPDDGMIVSRCSVEFQEGESLFDLTRRYCQENRIPFEFTMAPVYHTAYVEGIYNLYEFDCGSGSGWVYSVNGVIPSYGCSDYRIRSGDVLVWHYTCQLGNDIDPAGV